MFEKKENILLSDKKNAIKNLPYGFFKIYNLEIDQNGKPKPFLINSLS